MSPRAATRNSLRALPDIADVIGIHHLVNSERIKARFGSYRVGVLHQDATTRLASLCSRHGGGDICRTLAVTRFATPTPVALGQVDTLIREGHSIGSTWSKRRSISLGTSSPRPVRPAVTLSPNSRDIP